MDLAIAVLVGHFDHALQFLVGHPLTELLSHALEVLERDLSGVVVIEQTEGLHHLLFRVAVQDLVCLWPKWRCELV